MKLRKTKYERDIVAEAAKRALDDASGDVREATAMLESAVRQSRQLRDHITEPLISGACYDAIRAQIHVRRRAIWNDPKVVDPIASEAGANVVPLAKRGPDAERVVKLAAGTLLMFPLPGGKQLGEATRAEISAAADFYGGQAADMTTKARWLRLVAQSVPDGKRVADVLTDKRLRELQAEARLHAE